MSGGSHANSPLIAVVGDAALDIHMIVTGSDGPDEKTTATNGLRTVGGTGANAAVAIVRLGGRARLHANIGSDAIGGWIDTELAADGVDTSGLRRLPGRSTVAVIIHRPDGRSVIVDRGVSDDFGDDDLAGVLWEAEFVYLSGVEFAVIERVVGVASVPVVIGLEARQAGESTGDWSSDMASVLDRAAAIVMNEAGAAAFVPVVSRLRQTALVVTRGAAGASLLRPGSDPIVIAAPRVEVVDATGAGDCFAGTLCRFLAGGTSIEQSVVFATVAASLSTRRIGAQASIPTADELAVAVSLAR